MKKICLVCLVMWISLMGLNVVCGQSNSMKLTIEEVVGMAQGNTPDILLAKTRLSNSYWRFQAYKSGLKPQLLLNGDLPVLNRSISVVTQPDGSDVFVKRSFMTSALSVSVEQNIGLTGGRVFASTGLERIDIFSNTGNSSSFLTTPILIGINQPILGFNRFKWEKELEPLRYKESERNYTEEVEGKSIEAANYFFDIFISQINLSAAEKDKANADTLYRISKGRYNVGKIAENELLQMELSANQSEVNLAEATLQLQNSTENLRTFLDLVSNTVFDLVAPTDIPEYEIDLEQALTNARNNRQVELGFQRRMMEAEQEIARTKAESGFSANLFATFGLSGTDRNLAKSYANPVDQEQVRVGFQMPLADWGKGKSERKIAESNKELVERSITQERRAFEQEIRIKVMQFDLIRNRLSLAERSYEIAQKRYDITRKRYLIGKIGVTELNIALSEQTNARRAYMQALRSFWIAHYEIRWITLYDFEKDQAVHHRAD